MTSPFQEKITKVYNALTNKINSSISTHNSSSSSHQDLRNSKIGYGQVDSTSTSTVFTATVPNLNELVDGTTVMLRNGYVTSAEGFTLEVNGLGAKPVYSNMANATRDTTIFNINYTMLFVYDSTRVDGGCWICYRGYDANTNTVGYQIRTNSTPFTATDKGYKYRLWLETDGNKYMPVNTSTSTNATAKRSSAMNTREFWIGGKILYNATNGTTDANATMSTTTLWQQYTITLGYSFNNTGSALTLTPNEPLYMVAKAKGNGKAQLNTPYYTQTLPSTEDDLIYIYLGHMYSATALELALNHPVYEYKNGHIRLYQEAHTHTKTEITDFPSIPSKTSDLTNDSGFLTSHQDITGKEDNSNKVTSWSNTTTDAHYPSEKLVKSSLDNKQATLVSGTNIKTVNNNSLLGSGNITISSGTNVTKTSDLTNDGSDGTSTYVEADELATVATSGSYANLTNKPSYTATVTSSTTGAYKMGSINISGSSVDIYGKDTHQSLTNYIQKTSTDTGYLKSNGDIVSLPTASTSQSGVVQLSNSTSSSSETLGATAKAVKTVYDSIPTVPSASSTTPSADVSGGAVGIGTTWAKADHQHPLSNAYATSGHNHDSTYLKISDLPSIPSDIEDLTDDTGILHFNDYIAYNDMGSVPLSDFSNDLDVSDFTDNYDTEFTPKSHTHSTSDITDLYKYEISSSEYNPTIDSTITIYVKVTDGNNTGVSNHTFTMKTKNGDVSLTTDSNGQATHSYTCDTWGNQRFRVNGYSMFLNVTGWRTITRTNYTLWVNGAERLCEIRYYKSKASIGTSWTFVETISDSDYVPAPQQDSVYCACNMRGMVVRIFSSGSIQAQATTATSNQLFSFHTMWHY